jgi:CheY-like chemotaxis protein
MRQGSPILLGRGASMLGDEQRSDAGEARVASILLIDDSRVVRELLRTLLGADPGWVIVGEAADGRRGVEQAALLRPDAIVLDCEMPILDGLQAAPLLRAALPSARIVMWSSNTDAAESARAAGVDAFVDKADPLDSLLDALRLTKPLAAADGLPPPAAHDRPERRRRRAPTQVERTPALTRFTLALPQHRIQPGNTISYVDLAGRTRTVVLPADVAPNRPIQLPDGPATATSPYHLVLIPA